MVRKDKELVRRDGKLVRRTGSEVNDLSDDVGTFQQGCEIQGCTGSQGTVCKAFVVSPASAAE